MAKEWNVRCPHCRAAFVQTENQILAANVKATSRLLTSSGGPTARAALENYAIECDHCGQVMPFEPRSEFRRRKAVAVEQRLDAILALAPSPERAGPAVRIALAAGNTFMKPLSIDFPLDQLRDMAAKFRPLMEDEFESLGTDPNARAAKRLLEEILDIAGADVGERDDLPEAPRDEVSDKRDALLESMKALNEEHGGKHAAQAEPAVNKKSGGCFIATAACGTAQHDDVLRLCAFREQVLRPSAPGRACIRVYETISPPLARAISRSRAARFVVRRLVVKPARRFAEMRLNPAHAADAVRRLGIARFQLWSFRQLEIGELESRRHRAADETERRAGGKRGAEPGAGRYDDLRSLSRLEIEPEAADVPSAVRVEPENLERAPFVEVEHLVRPEAMERRRGLFGRDEKVDGRRRGPFAGV